jgi:hypothetical protein
MPTHQLLRQVKAKSLSVKIPENEPTTARLNCVLANEEFLTLDIPRYVLERFMVQAKRAIEEAPLLSRRPPSPLLEKKLVALIARRR